jgi:uncharacterized delta-60 repeat protein
MRNKLKMSGSWLLLIGLLSFLSTVKAAPGDLDAAFSQDGKLFDFFTSGGDDSIYGTAIQPDGKIVVAGQFGFGVVPSCALSRYNSDGTLDPTFDEDGRAIIPSGKAFICRAVAIQPDGKIVAAGSRNNGTNDDFAVVRYNPDGSLDTSFDADGIVTTSLGSFNDQAFAVAIQPDGKIVAAGLSYTGKSNFAVVRYNSNGSLDTSFDADGIVITSFSSSDDQAFAVAIQADGKIVAAGYALTADFALVRYNTNGSLDTSFDEDGKVTTPVGNSSDTARAVAIQPDGKIVAAGNSTINTGTFPPSQQSEFSLVRYNTDGSLDTSFDADGKVITTILNSNEKANAVALQTNGKIVIAGLRENSSGNEDFALVRYNADGSPDTSFDADGMVFTPVGASDDAANALAIQTDGRIVAAAGGSNFDFALVRYNTDGSLDTSFSSDGKMQDDVGLRTSSARAVAIQANGKIVVAGVSPNNIDGHYDFAAARYNADGSPDISFDGDGKVVTFLSSDNDEARAVAIQADGKIVVAGVNFNSSTPHFAVVRYNTDGSLDTSFDGDGKVFTSVGAFDQLYSVAIQADGKIVVAGASDSGSNFDFALVRYNTDGSLDTSFDADGMVTTPVMDLDQAYSIAIQADGKIVAAGRTYNGSNVDFALVRYNADGSLDTSFDEDGKVTTPVLSSDEWANSVAIQPDGKIVAAGFSNNGANNDFAVVRYNTNGSLDTSFDADGKLTTPVLSGADQANAVAIQANGKIVAAGYANNGNLNNDFALVRYNPDGSLDTTYNADGKLTFDFWGASNDFLYGMAFDSTGRVVVAGEASGNFAVARVLGDLAPNARSPFDFDGDGKTDISIFRPSDGSWWYSRSSDAQFRVYNFGVATDKLTPSDFTGDGKTDIAVWRPSTGEWFIQRSEDGSFYSIPFGTVGDIPVAGDYDGDGKADIAVFRPSTSTWFINKSSGGTLITTFGTGGDQPVVADYDGDGRTDIAIFRPSDGSWWYVRSSDGSFRVFSFGVSTDKPVEGDYTGDGKADIAVFRPSTGEWFIQRSEDNSYFSFPFGASGDLPVPGDYDGDGKFDPAVFRPSGNTWFVNRTTAGLLITNFGTNGDKPVPNVFVP